MGDILRAYELLNRTHKLGLTKEQLFRAEAEFKLDFAEQERFKKELKADPGQFMADWEFKSHLVPRARPISAKAQASMKDVAAEVAAAAGEKKSK
jgi:hypothetical protein